MHAKTLQNRIEALRVEIAWAETALTKAREAEQGEGAALDHLSTLYKRLNEARYHLRREVASLQGEEAPAYENLFVGRPVSTQFRQRLETRLEAAIAEDSPDVERLQQYLDSDHALSLRERWEAIASGFPEGARYARHCAEAFLQEQGHHAEDSVDAEIQYWFLSCDPVTVAAGSPPLQAAYIHSLIN